MKLYIKQHVFPGATSSQFTMLTKMKDTTLKARSFHSERSSTFTAPTELAYIEQRVFTLMPKYTVYRGDAEFARVVKEFTFFSPEYTVEGLGWKVCGY